MPGTRLCSRLSLDDFLNFDGPSGVVVAQDASRQTFFQHLGLQESSYRHRTIYKRMKEEAKAGMHRLFDSPASLDSDTLSGEAVMPPYSVSQMSEAAFQREVEKIYHTACRQTKGIYRLTQADNGQNWVIRWMLWHVLAGQDEGPRATSSSGETDCSITSPQSAKMAWSPKSYSTAKTSPVWTTATTSLHDISDSDEWDVEYEAKVKVRLEAPADEPKTPETPRKSAFWDHVMT